MRANDFLSELYFVSPGLCQWENQIEYNIPECSRIVIASRRGVRLDSTWLKTEVVKMFHRMNRIVVLSALLGWVALGLGAQPAWGQADQPAFPELPDVQFPDQPPMELGDLDFNADVEGFNNFGDASFDSQPQLSPAAEAALGILGLVFLVIWLTIVIAAIAGLWKTFSKAGKPGWGAIIPIYNVILLLEIAGKPIWCILLLLIPVVNFVIAILVSIEVAKNFGKGAGFGFGLAFLGFMFFRILHFGNAQYRPTNG